MVQIFIYKQNFDRFQTEAALIRDAVLTLAKSFKGNRTLIENLYPPHLTCSYSNDKLNPTEYPVWENGRTILKNIDEVCSKTLQFCSTENEIPNFSHYFS